MKIQNKNNGEIATKNLRRDQSYEARGVVAKYFKIGEYQANILLQIPVYKFLTLDRGNGEFIPVEFIKTAPVKADLSGEAVLDIERLEEGDVVVHPGLVYRKCMWNPNLQAAHLKALQTYKRKDIIISEKADAPSIDLGFENFSSEKITVKDHEKGQAKTQ